MNLFSKKFNLFQTPVFSAMASHQPPSAFQTDVEITMEEAVVDTHDEQEAPNMGTSDGPSLELSLYVGDSRGVSFSSVVNVSAAAAMAASGEGEHQQPAVKRAKMEETAMVEGESYPSLELKLAVGDSRTPMASHEQGLSAAEIHDAMNVEPSLVELKLFVGDSTNSSALAFHQNRAGDVPEPEAPPRSSSHPSLELSLLVGDSRNPKMGEVEVSDNGGGDDEENPNAVLYHFPCQYCGKRFSSGHALGGHQNAHREERKIMKQLQEFPSLSTPHMHNHQCYGSLSYLKMMAPFSAGPVLQPTVPGQYQWNPARRFGTSRLLPSMGGFLQNHRGLSGLGLNPMFATSSLFGGGSRGSRGGGGEGCGSTVTVPGAASSSCGVRRPPYLGRETMNQEVDQNVNEDASGLDLTLKL